MYADKVGVDVYEVIESSNSQKFSHIHQPGISVGGHCIPIYPQFYLWSDPEASIVRKARETNSQMPRYFVNEILKSFDTFKNLKVLILGISYRANVKEIAFSGAVELKNILVDSGAKVFALDPFYTKSEINEIGFEYEEDLSKGFDAVILHTNHREFSEIDFKKFSKGTKLLDGRNFYSKEKVPSGIDYFKFGNLTKGKY
jgi:nucleotide sugar dehydrogenase